MSTFYHSTRSQNESVTSKKAIRTGIAPDGGLYVSDALGERRVSLEGLGAKSYRELACEVMGALLPDYTAEELAACVDEAYGATFASDEVTPVVALDKAPGEGATPTYVLELWHGPTSAFKDVALQMLPRLMARTAEPGEDARDIMIVTATSGDTGKAALAGFADAPHTAITVFYPEGKVSHVQELQMTTQGGGNVAVCAVRGNFDDAQSAVKRIFADHGLAARLADRGMALSSANSINVGRLVPQVVYYFAAYAQLMRSGAIHEGDAVEFCVPTGNFGDVLAGYYAKRLGLPVAKLIVASDANNVLFDFLETGTYDRQREFFTTTSPSMDILISSNLERMLYYFSEGNAELVASLMADLAEKGSYTLPAEMHERIREVFEGGWASEDEVAAAIAQCWDANGYVIDPHTACGYHVLAKTAPAPGAAARVLLSTASPYKFPRVVASSLGLEVPESDFACMRALSQATGTTAPAQLASLEDAEARFSDVVAVDEMGAYVEGSCERLLA